MISDAGLNIIKDFEKCRLEAYLDTLASPPVWTVGWGQTGPHVQKGTTWTQHRADHELLITVNATTKEVRSACAVPPNENQLAAMVSLTYNIGIGNFRKSSVLRLHNQSKFAEAANAFAMWNKAGGKVRAGLTRRRSVEAALYLTPVGDDEQTTRATPEARDPAAKPPVAAIAAGAGAALTGAQQAVAQVSSIWDGLAAIGISPHVLMGVLGVAAIGALGWFVWSEWKRRQEGSR
jgi:lysozyme